MGSLGKGCRRFWVCLVEGFFAFIGMLSGKVDASEPLGRCCFSSSDAGRDRPRQRFVATSFVDGRMSVDRMETADLQRLTLLHDEEGAGRVPARSFHGWYEFTAAVIRSVGWEAVPKRTAVNPWHAEVLWAAGDEDKDVFRERCLKLAADAVWRPRPMSSSDEEFLDQVSERLGP